MSTNVDSSTTDTEEEKTTEEETTEEEQKKATTGFKFSGESKGYRGYHPDQWTAPKEVMFSDFTITETDLRVKTATFDSPYDIDLTKGQVCLWIQRKYGDNFGGIILSKEFDKESGMYTYTCQDWNRLLNSKVQVILGGDITTYDIIKILLVKMGLSTDGLHEIDYYDYTLERVPDDDDPSESLTAGDSKNVYSANTPAEDNNENSKSRDVGTSKDDKNKNTKRNPFKLKPMGLYDKMTALDFIRTLILKAGATIDFYMDENGVPRFDKYEKDDWLKKRWYFVDTDVYDTKLKFDLTDIITQVAVKRVDPLNPNATLYTSEKLVGVNLAKYFGVMGDVVDNPVPQSSGDAGATAGGGDTITVTGKSSCGHCSGKTSYSVTVTRTYKNKCPFCGKSNLQDTPKDPSRKRIPEGEITCGGGAINGKHDGCDADFCVNCGHEKMTRDAAQLTPVGASFDGGDTGGSSSSSTKTTTTRSGTSASSGTTTTTATTGTSGSSIAVEDLKKNKQIARITMSQSIRKLVTFTIKLPGEFNNLHTNSFCMLMTSQKFLMENLPEIGRKLDGKFTRYSGFERNRYYIEEVTVNYTPNQGVYTELKLNPFASDYSNFAKQQIQAESALASALGGGGLANANGQDCPDNSMRTNRISVPYGGSATSQTPSAKALAVVGNSSANYAEVASKYNTPQEILADLHSRYHWVDYDDNRAGDCPRELYASGSINCNCAGAAWLVKCVFDCKGWQNYILHGSPCSRGHYWNCVQYNGQWIMGDLCYWKQSHNQLSKMV